MKELTSLFALLNFVFHLVHSHSESCKSVSFDTCSIEERSCVIHEDSLIESLAVTDLDECRQRCGGLENCQYFSHFGAGSFPFSDYCILFSSCSTLDYCGKDCYTEDKLCHGDCGRNVVSKLGDNVLKLVPDVILERNCKAICLTDADCLYYTYYGNGNLCILLSDIVSTSQECDHCVTSVPNCRNTSYIPCKFTINSNQTLHDSYVFTNVYNAINITFSPASIFGCEAKIVAIGGGGCGVRGGGGGSGYVKSKVIDVTSTNYQVSVGQYGQDSFFQKNDGQKLITAQRGEDGHGTRPTNRGGNGYSGGGQGSNNRGEGSTKGGSNGSDGEGANGGSGSGFDIATISLEHHILSQGNGGEPVGYYYGGGGGGVLVDNVGPSSGTNQGEGYGGGGANVPQHRIGSTQNLPEGFGSAQNFPSLRYDSGSGLQGMVLIEAKPKT